MRAVIYRTAAAFAATLLLCGAPVVSASAQEQTQEQPQVIIQNRVVLTLRTSAAGLSPVERAAVVRKRLGPILTLTNLRADDVQVRQNAKYQDAAIYVREHLLITVDPGLARANSTTPLLLAEGWAQTLRDLLPRVNVSVYTPTSPQVVYNNRILMTISTGLNGQTPQDRADDIRKRLGSILLLNDLKPEDVELRQAQAGSMASIYIRGRLLVDVDAKLARMFAASPKELAKQWADGLREVLPQLNVNVTSPQISSR